MSCHHEDVIHPLTLPLFLRDFSFGNSALEPGWIAKETQLGEEDHGKSKPAVTIVPLKALGEAQGELSCS